MFYTNDPFWAGEYEADANRLESKYAMSNEQAMAAAVCDYHSDFTAVSKTMLNVFYDSPLEYKLTFIDRAMEPQKPTKYMELGSICHAVLLERRELHDVVASYPAECFNSNGNLNGAKAQSFRELMPGRICLKRTKLFEIRDMLKSLEDSELAEAIQAATDMEKRVDADLCGIACKCKPDIVCDLGDYIAAYDLKFCERIGQRIFNRLSNNKRYWLQDAHYSAILQERFGKPVQFRFFAIEVKYPYRIQAYWYDARSREIARDSHKLKLEELRECLNTGQWRDRWESELTLNPWDVDEQDQLVEFGEAEV